MDGAVATSVCEAAAVGAAACCPTSVLAVASVSSIPAKKSISVEIVCQYSQGLSRPQDGEVFLQSCQALPVLDFTHTEG